eukprot:scaffold7458_cov61-Phaeocystis_antarctica.AAC.1
MPRSSHHASKLSPELSAIDARSLAGWLHPCCSWASSTSVLGTMSEARKRATPSGETVARKQKPRQLAVAWPESMHRKK